MNSEQKKGADLHGDDRAARKAAAAMMGSARTPAKIEAARQNALAAASARKGAGTSDAQKQAVREHWQRYRAEKAASATAIESAQPTEPKRRGRPAKEKPETSEPKRGRGRPRNAETSQTNTQETTNALQVVP